MLTGACTNFNSSAFPYGDGHLSCAELAANIPILAPYFSRIDQNHNGRISRTELVHAIQTMRRRGRRAHRTGSGPVNAFTRDRCVCGDARNRTAHGQPWSSGNATRERSQHVHTGLAGMTRAEIGRGEVRMKKASAVASTTPTL